MKKRLSDLFLVMSIGFIVAAGCLFVSDQQLEYTAQTTSATVLKTVQEKMEANIEAAPQKNLIPVPTTETVETEVLVGEDLYFAVLEIPVLGLALPIQSNWSYPKLQKTPCLYQEQPMSIAAHNYRSHFGRLTELLVGDTASLTYLSGETEVYQVVLLEMVYETDIAQLDNEAYDLTLFTCNYKNNTERILVRLQKIKG